MRRGGPSGCPAIQQNRPAGPGADRPVDGPPDGWWQWDEDDLGGFEDTQAEQSEHGRKREVARVCGLAARGEQGLELQMGEPKRR